MKRFIVCEFTDEEVASIERMRKAARKPSKSKVIEAIMREIIQDEMADRAGEERAA